MIDFRESHAYQLILEQGIAEGKAQAKVETFREMILLQGRKKFGKPSAKVSRELNALTDIERLTELFDHILDVSTWKELLINKH